jgi:colanic acid/amylovoran biosynthesis protein
VSEGRTASTSVERAHPTHKRKDLVIGLFGHSVNSDNLGVGALTISHIAILELICDRVEIEPELWLCGPTGGKEPYFRAKHVSAMPIRMRAFVAPFNGLYSAIRRCDVILDIAGGDSFTDIYGLERFVRITLPKAVVLLARRPLILSPQTIGPFRRRWTRWIATQLMRRAYSVVSRDYLSSDFVSQLGLGSRLIDSTDVAFRLPYTLPAPRTARGVRVGLNISGLLFNGGYTQNNMFGLSLDYAKLARALLEYFSRLPGCELHLIGHVNSERFPIEDDYRVAAELQMQFPTTILAPRFSTPSEAKSYIAGMDFFLGSRMHACIAALSSGVPVLPIAYSRKFAGVFGGLGYSLVADCRTASLEEVLRKAVDAFERRNELIADVQTARANADKKLAAYEIVLKECLLDAAEKRA